MAGEGVAVDRDTITRQIEVILRQLEELKFSLNHTLAERLCGGIEMLLWCRDGKGGAAGDVKTRMDRAARAVMTVKPEAPGMQLGPRADLKPQLIRPTISPPSVPTADNPSVDLKPKTVAQLAEEQASERAAAVSAPAPMAAMPPQPANGPTAVQEQQSEIPQAKTEAPAAPQPGSGEGPSQQ